MCEHMRTLFESHANHMCKTCEIRLYMELDYAKKIKIGKPTCAVFHM